MRHVGCVGLYVHTDYQNQGVGTALMKAMLELADMEQPPLRIFFGKGLNALIHGEYQKRLDEWDAHNALSERAHG